MTTSAYLLIRASETVRHNGYVKALEELWALPGIEYVEPVSGLYDCVARVEAPTRLIFLVHKVMAKSWVERVHALSVDQPVQAALESEQTQTARLMRQREIIKAYSAGLARPAGPEPEFHPGEAGPTGAETTWAARLRRQRQIIKAYYAKRRAASQAGPPKEESQDLAEAA